MTNLETTIPSCLPAIAPDWHATAFDALYPLVYAHRTVEAAAPEANFAIEKLGLECGDKVLDLCCGAGRHMAHFQRWCGRVFGLDYSADLLALAAENHDLAGELVRGDMRRLPFADAAFDAVVNFFTSFGYFGTQAENVQVLAEIRRVLRPRGRFLMDYLNARHLRDTLVPESERDLGGFRIVERRWIDADNCRVNKTTSVYRGGELITQAGESVRLYEIPELCALIESAGLRVDAQFGDFSGSPVDNALPRVILIGHKE